jgi:hypothetical protein
MKYLVEGSKVVEREEVIEADSYREAALKFMENDDGIKPAWVGEQTEFLERDARTTVNLFGSPFDGGEAKDVIGFDEGDGTPIFDGDKYYCDSDGCYTLVQAAPENGPRGGV